VVVAGLPGHEAGEALPPAVDEVDPLVVPERLVPVGGFGDLEQLRDRSDVPPAHLLFHLEVHVANLSSGVMAKTKPRTPKGRARETAARLAADYPGTAKELCALQHNNPFELLAATILSAQTTDERVNMVTPAVFAKYPTPADLAGADPAELEEIVKSTGFFRSKTKSLIGMAAGLEERFGGEVPTAIEDLVTLPGVGRKTANVIRSVDFDLPGLPVDTHVGRLSRRLGLTQETDPVKAEFALDALLSPAEWGSFSLRLILHGRRVCYARKPDCPNCVLNDFCPSAVLPTG
jgi:endonuclease-3